MSQYDPASEPPAPTRTARKARSAARAVTGAAVRGSVLHSDGTSVAHVALTLIDTTGAQVGRGATGEDGRYELGIPGPGPYVLIAAVQGHQPQAVTLRVGARPVELDVTLIGGVGLAGRVRTPQGSPVGDAAVTLTDIHGEVVATTRSRRGGEYLIGGLVAGDYTLAAMAPAYRPCALPVSLEASPGVSREIRQDLELAAGAVLGGTARAGGGRVVEYARVTLLDAAGNVVDTATTGPDGSFRFAGLAAGEYTVMAAGYPPAATVLRVAGGGRTERDVQLDHPD